MSPVIQRNNVHVLGRGTQPIIFAHGLGCDQGMWRYLVPDFVADYRVILFDYVGAGRSDWRACRAERYATLDGYKRDVLEVCAALQLEKPIFVGHSVSAMVGILASIQAPALFERLILMAPSPCHINRLGYVGGFERADIESLLEMMDQNFVGWANFLAPVVINDASQMGRVRELEQSFCASDPDIVRRFARATFLGDHRAALPRVSVPSLILQCRHDALAPLEVGHYLHRNLTGSSLCILEAAGHCPHLTHPAETSRAIVNYLEENQG